MPFKIYLLTISLSVFSPGVTLLLSKSIYQTYFMPYYSNIFRCSKTKNYTSKNLKIIVKKIELSEV